MTELFSIPKHLNSRSISFENPEGDTGGGAKAASPLGVGRKGAPARMILPGETVRLAGIGGPGVIRHIWITTYPIVDTMRGLVVRAYWEGQSNPSIEAPLGDLFGFAHGASSAFQSAVHSVGKECSLNLWIPMPFSKRAEITISNDLDFSVPIFYQIDYTVGDELAASFGRLHALFRREVATTPTRDFELLPKRSGSGRFLGAVIGVLPTDSSWWGEGEVKMFIDGDDQYPTIVGTGAEDYVGQSWGAQETPFLYHGASRAGTDNTDTGPVSMYRWHIPDPVYWHEDIRITIQQIGHKGAPKSLAEYQGNLFERSDDWCCCSFWYEPTPSAQLPDFPSLELRLAGLDRVEDASLLPLQDGFRGRM